MKNKNLLLVFICTDWIIVGKITKKNLNLQIFVEKKPFKMTVSFRKISNFAAENKNKVMRHTIIAVVGAMLFTAFTACNDYETYAEKKADERSSIDAFLNDSAFTVITEEQFHAQGDSTSVAGREFVLLDKSGVYMQIVRRGNGDYIKDGENVNLICRFFEMNLQTKGILYNNSYYVFVEDKLYVKRTGSTFTASFVEGQMYSTYGGSVPAGWLVPFSYIKVGRLSNDLSKVRLIVPHSQGHSIASQNVYPYYYEITFQRER